MSTCLLQPSNSSNLERENIIHPFMKGYESRTSFHASINNDACFCTYDLTSLVVIMFHVVYSSHPKQCHSGLNLLDGFNVISYLRALILCNLKHACNFFNEFVYN